MVFAVKKVIDLVRGILTHLIFRKGIKRGKVMTKLMLGAWIILSLSILNESWFWTLSGLVLIFFTFLHIWRLWQQLRDFQMELTENIFIE